MPLRLIVAVNPQGVIGCHGRLPWRQSADLRRFKELTMGQAMIMGRKTQESIGRLLPGRKSIVLTHQRRLPIELPPRLFFAHDLSTALDLAFSSCDSPFVIGGGEVFRQSLPHVQEVFRTRIDAHIEGDAFFHLDPNQWKVTSTESFSADADNEFDYTFETLSRISPTPNVGSATDRSIPHCLVTN